jgi:hypothetical protein
MLGHSQIKPCSLFLWLLLSMRISAHAVLCCVLHMGGVYLLCSLSLPSGAHTRSLSPLVCRKEYRNIRTHDVSCSVLSRRCVCLPAYFLPCQEYK